MTTALLLALALCAVAERPTTPAAADPWAPIRFLEGDWIGTAEGEPGIGTVHRSYQFILGYRFLHERNTSAYVPRQPNTGGELHEHWSVLSYDKKRKLLVLRQFHQEGFVNQYVLDPDKSTTTRLVFISEGFENLDSSWRARETYDLAPPNSFTETFELAEPGKDFATYSKNKFKRAGTR
jgi:hypothetical protein